MQDADLKQRKRKLNVARDAAKEQAKGVATEIDDFNMLRDSEIDALQKRIAARAFARVGFATGLLVSSRDAMLCYDTVSFRSPPVSSPPSSLPPPTHLPSGSRSKAVEMERIAELESKMREAEAARTKLASVLLKVMQREGSTDLPADLAAMASQYVAVMPSAVTPRIGTKD